MKSSSLLTIGAVGLLAYFVLKNTTASPDTLGSGGAGFYSTTPSVSDGTLRGDRGPQVVRASSATGQPITQVISTPAEGVAFINANIGNLQTPAQNLIRQNTTFTDGQGNTYRTGSNQTVDRLANGQVKVLTVKSVPKSQSFFQKPIRVINGKRTRVY